MKNQRILKFRAWDNKTKKFIATDFHILGEVMCFGLIEQYIDENMCGAKSSLDRWNDIVITQFTGLQDKNKKDIYDGDILRVFRPHTYITKVFWGKNGYCVAPFYLKDYGKMECDDLCGRYYMPHETEIIGNTFETPDLLNKNI